MLREIEGPVFVAIEHSHAFQVSGGTCEFSVEPRVFDFIDGDDRARQGQEAGGQSDVAEHCCFGCSALPAAWIPVLCAIVLGITGLMKREETKWSYGDEDLQWK